MKKYLFAFVILSVLVPASVFAETSNVISEQAQIDALLQKINLLYGEIYKLGGKVETTISTDGKITVDGTKTDSENDETEKMRRSKDKTPRIMYLWGKVNQHFNIKTGYWETDPDGVSGANIDMLKYCQKWYPNTRSVKEHKFETIKNWKNRGNVLNFEARKMSFECSEKVSSKPVITETDTTTAPTTNTTVWSDDSNNGNEEGDMQIMYWWGKVNQHMEIGDWETDPDGVSGADLNMLTYCRKWYPNSIAVKENKLVTTDGWKNRGNLSEFTSTKMSYYCVQK